MEEEFKQLLGYFGRSQEFVSILVLMEEEFKLDIYIILYPR